MWLRIWTVLTFKVTAFALSLFIFVATGLGFGCLYVIFCAFSLGLGAI